MIEKLRSRSMRMIVIVISMILLSTTAMADVDKGKRFYMKHLKQKFKMDGLTFVKLHTQGEWQQLFSNDAEGFVTAFSKRFPKRAKYLDQHKTRVKLQDVADFAMMYAKDSGKVPSCSDIKGEAVPFELEAQESSSDNFF